MEPDLQGFHNFRPLRTTHASFNFFEKFKLVLRVFKKLRLVFYFIFNEIVTQIMFYFLTISSSSIMFLVILKFCRAIMNKLSHFVINNSQELIYLHFIRLIYKLSLVYNESG